MELEALYLPDIDPGEERCDPATLLDSVAHHIRRVDETTSRSTLDRYQYACAKTVLLLYNHSSSECRNELLICKLLAVLFDGLYRSHYDDVVYVYDHGSWNRVFGLPYVALEFATSTIRAAEGAFALIQSESPNTARAWIPIAHQLGRMFAEKSIADLTSATVERLSNDGSWMGDVAKLCSSLFKSFADPGRDRVIFANFANWASSSIPEDQRGVNFENMYFDISSGNGDDVATICARSPKSPDRNCYTRAPYCINRRLPDIAIRRMHRFLPTAFACSEGAIRMMLSYMALVACNSGTPEVISVFVGRGGEGKALLLSDLMLCPGYRVRGRSDFYFPDA